MATTQCWIWIHIIQVDFDPRTLNQQLNSQIFNVWRYIANIFMTDSSKMLSSRSISATRECAGKNLRSEQQKAVVWKEARFLQCKNSEPDILQFPNSFEVLYIFIAVGEVYRILSRWTKRPTAYSYSNIFLLKWQIYNLPSYFPESSNNAGLSRFILGVVRKPTEPRRKMNEQQQSGHQPV